ncbi:MAG: copper chaperone PCu(A)C [Alphaproteobacteria bacterium]|nr:copper chaperone PCu(A)C [Alphaproteobacteria bacterium]
MTCMKTLARAAACAAMIAAAPAAAQTHGHHGHDASHMTGMHVAHGWARATPGVARAGAAFITLHNRSDAEDRLIAIETPAAARAAIHTHIMDGSVMKMRELADGVAVAPGKEVIFKPGGLHVMLIGLKAPLKEGDTFPLTFTFEKAGRQTVEIAVRGVGAMAPGGGHGGGHSH